MMPEVCKDTKIEPKLTLLSGEKLQDRTLNNSSEAKVDRYQDSRFLGKKATDIFRLFRVFDPSACRYRSKSLQQCHVMNEQEKKRAYSERIL